MHDPIHVDLIDGSSDKSTDCSTTSKRFAIFPVTCEEAWEAGLSEAETAHTSIALPFIQPYSYSLTIRRRSGSTCTPPIQRRPPQSFINPTILISPIPIFSPTYFSPQAIYLPSFTKPVTKLIMVAQTAAFKKAVEDSRKLKAKPNNDELLEVLCFSRLCFSGGVSSTRSSLILL